MKILGSIIYLVSSLWLLGIFLQPFAPFVSGAFASSPTLWRWFCHLPQPPPPLGPYTWANAWPAALGLGGILIATALICAAQRQRKGGASEA